MIIEGVLNSKNLFSGGPLYGPRRPFGGPLAAILDFEGGAVFVRVRGVSTKMIEYYMNISAQQFGTF